MSLTKVVLPLVAAYSSAAALGYHEGTEMRIADTVPVLGIYTAGWALTSGSIIEREGSLDLFKYCMIPLTLDITRKTFQVVGIAAEYLQ